MVVRMSLGHYIMLFRREYVRTINWGGKPEKTIESTEDGAKYFGPRRSFKLYTDTVSVFCGFFLFFWMFVGVAGPGL